MRRISLILTAFLAAHCCDTAPTDPPDECPQHEPCAVDSDCPGLGRYCGGSCCADVRLPGDACDRGAMCCSGVCEGNVCGPKVSGDTCPP